MTMLAQKHSSPVIQVMVKQTETNPGLIGLVSGRQSGPPWTYQTPTASVILSCLPPRSVSSPQRWRRFQKMLLILLGA